MVTQNNNSWSLGEHFLLKEPESLANLARYIIILILQLVFEDPIAIPCCFQRTRVFPPGYLLANRQVSVSAVWPKPIGNFADTKCVHA